MQCTAAYPADYAELDLGVIQTYRERYPECVIGYSGHDNSISMPVVAYMLGRPDHREALHAEPGDEGDRSHLLAGAARPAAGGAGSDARPPGDRRRRQEEAAVSEFAPMVKMAKSLYAARPLPAGHVLAEADLAIKCPGGGMPPYELDNVIGRTLLVDLDEEAQLGARAPRAGRCAGGSGRRATVGHPHPLAPRCARARREHRLRRLLRSSADGERRRRRFGASAACQPEPARDRIG